MHLAAHFGHRAALRQLLLARCAADAARRDGATALHLAAEAGQLEIVKMLLEARKGMGYTIYAGARKCRKVVNHCVFPMFRGTGGSKSRLAKAAGAEPGDEKWHAVVVRSTF